MKNSLLVCLLLLLSGCAAVPPALTYLGYVKTGADCVSYLATKKSTTDHVISSIRHEDCAMHRVLWHEQVCRRPYESLDNIAALKARALAAQPAAGRPSWERTMGMTVSAGRTKFQ